MKYFTISEFDSPDQDASGRNMDPHFLDLLDEIREEAGIPFVINSGFRTPLRNQIDGGKGDSAHLKGKAADVAAPSGTEKFLIVQAALVKGIKRIGIGKTFIHLDVDETLPSPVIWTY